MIANIFEYLLCSKSLHNLTHLLFIALEVIRIIIPTSGRRKQSTERLTCSRLFIWKVAGQDLNPSSLEPSRTWASTLHFLIKEVAFEIEFEQY